MSIARDVSLKFYFFSSLSWLTCRPSSFLCPLWAVPEVTLRTFPPRPKSEQRSISAKPGLALAALGLPPLLPAAGVEGAGAVVQGVARVSCSLRMCTTQNLEVRCD